MRNSQSDWLTTYCHFRRTSCPMTIRDRLPTAKVSICCWSCRLTLLTPGLSVLHMAFSDNSSSGSLCVRGRWKRQELTSGSLLHAREVEDAGMGSKSDINRPQVCACMRRRREQSRNAIEIHLRSRLYARRCRTRKRCRNAIGIHLQRALASEGGGGTV